MKKKDLNFKHLIYYIVAIQQFRNPSFDKKLKLTEILFQTKQYDLAISDIKRYLGIPKSIKIKVESRTDLPPRIAARIILTADDADNPHIDPNHTYLLQIKKESLDNFDVFVVYIVHELCHLKLFLDRTKVHLPQRGSVYLWREEKAVDTLGILAGFGKSYFRIRYRFTEPEYISREEFYFLYDCFIQNRVFKQKAKNRTVKKIPWYKKIFSKFRP